MTTTLNRAMISFRPLLAIAAVLALFAMPTNAAPKKSGTGETCTSSGTERRDGKDAATGEKFNCLFDYCTYCSTSGGQIDCTKMVTEYTNGRDCKAAARTGASKAGQGSFPPGGGVLDPGSRKTRPLETAPRNQKLLQQ